MKSVSELKNIKLTKSLSENMTLFRGIFKKDSVLRSREIRAKSGFSVGIFYFDGMVNNQIINESVVRPIVLCESEPWIDIAAFLLSSVIFTGEAKICEKCEDMVRSILYGDTLILIDGTEKAIVVNSKGWRTRGISEPENERILEGPREGFDEAAMFNLAMIRRKLLTPDFSVESLRMGRRTDTMVFICYLDSLTDEKTLGILKERLSKIDIDGILDTNYISEQIRDNPHSVFKTAGVTERPDIVAANLLEGRIAVVVDGTPVVLTVPYLFSENFQSDEDYYTDYKMASASRLLRIICFLLSITVPGLYLAVTAFHIRLLPPAFALSIAAARQGVPFSPTAEALLIIFVFETLKEAGLRMPQSVGHALSIVGGLVVGQAAVEAKIISAPMLIAVALSGIAGLMVPRLRTAVFISRIAITVLSAVFGIYGTLSFLVLLLAHILSIRSFGRDYTESLRSLSRQSQKDTFIRSRWSSMIKRPKIQNRDEKRQNEKNN